jgi:hypothetical protein
MRRIGAMLISIADAQDKADAEKKMVGEG